MLLVLGLSRFNRSGKTHNKTINSIDLKINIIPVIWMFPILILKNLLVKYMMQDSKKSL